MANTNLIKASKAKNDEFYTQLVDIENELKYYKEQFRGKVVFLNCDDPFESNFFKYFAANFKHLGLKKLITTSYRPSPIANTQLGLFGDDKTIAPVKGRAKVTANKFIINDVGDLDNDGAFTIQDIAEQLRANKNNEWSPLDGDGDFRSNECVELLQESDIVCTNPPFSLYREYIAQLMEYDKKFLIVGDDNWVTLKETFVLLQKNKMWKGYGRVKKFIQPSGEMKAFGNKCWYTNLDVAKRHYILTLYKKYTPEEYPTYDNYDAIEVSKVSDIPVDYGKAMGVPITFLDKYNPEQFEILGITDRENSSGLKTKVYSSSDNPKHGDMNRRGSIKVGDSYKLTYARILIKRKASK